jgi:hypothetical protein
MIRLTWKDGDTTEEMILPEGSPSYNELLEEKNRLVRENAKLIDELAKTRIKDKDLWGTLEDVCCSARPE